MALLDHCGSQVGQVQGGEGQGGIFHKLNCFLRLPLVRKILRNPKYISVRGSEIIGICCCTSQRFQECNCAAISTFGTSHRFQE